MKNIKILGPVCIGFVLAITLSCNSDLPTEKRVKNSANYSNQQVKPPLSSSEKALIDSLFHFICSKDSISTGDFKYLFGNHLYRTDSFVSSKSPYRSLIFHEVFNYFQKYGDFCETGVGFKKNWKGNISSFETSKYSTRVSIDLNYKTLEVSIRKGVSDIWIDNLRIQNEPWVLSKFDEE